VIISTGSFACPKTGSDGLGYKILNSLGHSLITPLPALVQLKANAPYLKEWHGIRSDVSVTLLENNTPISNQIGEIQLTDYGVSGICIFCLSGQVSRGLYNNKKEEISINFLHPFNINTKEEFITWMNNRNNIVKNRTISDLLDGLLNYKLINLILKISKIDRNISWNKLSNNEKYLLGTNLTNFSLNITGTNSFEQAQTATGGIPLSEINPVTMESIYNKGLYITGELLDIDGDCGGYNLTNAWITGMLAGKDSSND
jgi:predicted Rossmann fold flavoprotein